MFRRLALALTLALSPSLALAQATSWPPPAGAIAFLCVFNTVLPTMTSGQVGFAQCDQHGQILTSGGGGGGGSVTQGTVPWVVSGQGTAGTAATGVVTVQGIASMTALQVAQATAANLNATVVGTGTFATQATLAAETTKVIGTVNQGTSPWVTSGTSTVSGTVSATQGTSPWVVSNSGTFAVQAAQSTASNLNATVVGTGTFVVQSTDTPATSGGLSVFNLQPTASDNHAVIKAGAGQVYKISITGNATQTTVQYIRLYNATTGFNGCNSATNLVYQNAIPFSLNGAGILDFWPTGMAFATGISICVTGGYAQTDTTNATASAMIVNIGYK